jgi:CBS domain-containing membrane protein
MQRRLSFFKKAITSSYVIRVNEILDDTIRPVLPDDLIIKVKSIFRSRGICQIPVTNEGSKLVGTVKRYKFLKSSSKTSAMLVQDVLEEVLLYTCIKTEIKEITEEMLQRREDCIPVIEDEQNKRYSGILSLENVMDALTKINTELLNSKVIDVVKKNKGFCYSDDTLFKVWEKMKEENTNGLFVLDKDKKVVGVITHYDVLIAKIPGLNIALENHKESNYITVNKIMNKNVIKIRPNCTIIEAAKTMLKYKISRLPIVGSNNEYLGSITKDDIVKYLLPSIQ